jgi:hypothetical protein
MSALIAVLTLAPLALCISRGRGTATASRDRHLTATVPLVLLFFPALIEVLGQLRWKKAKPLPYNG